MGFLEDIRKEPSGGKPVTFTPRPAILLSANTVKPMHGVVPRVILGKAWWDLTRQNAYKSTGFHCIACGVSKYQAEEHQWLEGHEVYKIEYAKGRQTYLETVPLCHYCHSFIHCGRMEALMHQGYFPPEKFDRVMAHGNKVLRGAGVVRPRPYTGSVARWSKWRLVLFGKFYPPLYRTEQDWLKAFGQTPPED
jgi:hypothetical protein